MAEAGVDVTRVASTRTPIGPKGHARSLRWAAVVLLALEAGSPSLARAADVCFFPDIPNGSTPQDYNSTRCATEITWPTSWTAVNTSTEATGDLSPDLAQYDLIGSTSYPGLYVKKMYVPLRQESYLFFRLRVNLATAVSATTGSPYVAPNALGTAFWILTMNNPTGDLKPYFAISWDIHNVADPSHHGMEMEYQKGTLELPALWEKIDFWDIDNLDTGKCTSDIDGSSNCPVCNATCAADFTRKEGYVRTVDSVVEGGVTSTFIEMAVSCAYFSRTEVLNNAFIKAHNFNPCVQPTWSSAAMATSINDNTVWSQKFSQIDIYGIGTWTSSTAISAASWSAQYNPTAVVVSGLRTRVAPGGVEVSWETASEVSTAGFDLYRKDRATGLPVKVNAGFVPAVHGSPNGGRYRVRDPGASRDQEETYVLEEIEFQGTRREYGPFKVRAEHDGREPSPEKSGQIAGESRDDDPGKARLLRATRGQKEGRKSNGTVRPGGATAHVVVTQEGLQVVSATDVAAALGLSEHAARTLVRERKLRITGPEGDVACQPAADGARLYFLGRPLHSTWANTSVYRLTRGDCPAFDIARGSPPRGTPAAGATVFIGRDRAEQDLIPTTTLFRDPGEDFWLWNFLVGGSSSTGSARYDLIAPDATGGPGEVTVHLQGSTSVGPGPDHHVRVTLNATALGETRWAGATPVAASFTVPAGTFLPTGANTLQVEALLDPGIPYSVLALDAIDFSWERRARASADQLTLPAGTSGDVVVEGFGGDDVWALDLARTGHPARLSGLSTGSRDGSTFARVLLPRGSGPFLLVRPAAASVPLVSPVQAHPALATLARRGADYLIVTSPRLEAASGRLAAIRQRAGLDAIVVTTDRIYDRYTGGNLDPVAIRSFLADVRATWHRVPRFVVLAGNGTYDGRNLLGVDDNHVPPMLVATPNGLASSDVALADVAGDDGVPEFAIGRIPASTEVELHAYLDKLEAFEAGAGAWSDRAFFLADNADNGGDFASDSAISVARLAGSMSVVEATLAGNATATRAQVLGALGEGLGLFHYFGHAGVDRLANEGLLTSADVDALVNGGRAPLAMLMTCVAGSYGYPGYDSLGVRLTMNPVGGAIATWTPSSLEMEVDSSFLSQEVLGRLSASPPSTFGEAIRAGLAASRDAGSPLHTRLTYNLFGDPAVVLRP